MSKLVDHVRNITETKEAQRLREITGEQPSQKTSPPGPESFAEEIREKFAKLLFGRYGEMNATPAMKRMLDSWLELGYPISALQRFRDKEDRTGRVLSRDSLGLPSLMRERQKKLQMAPKPKPVPVIVKYDRHYWGPIEKAPQPEYPLGSSRNPLQPKQAPVQAIIPRRARDPTDRGYDSVELEERSPEPVPVPEDESPSSAGRSRRTSSTTGSRATSPGIPTFWDFERTHRTDYENCLYPMTEEELSKTRVHCQPKESLSPEITDEGITVVRGFKKPPPAESHAMLKEIEERAVRINIESLAREEDEHYFLCGDCAYCVERRRGKMPEIEEESSDKGTIRHTRPIYESTVSPDSDPPASLTVETPYDESLSSSDQKRFEEFFRKLNLRIPARKEVVNSDSLPSLTGSSWKPLGDSYLAKEA
ncbi:MAG: hypothetical protein Q9222_007204 [Ikaeria aurantiellina]